MHTFSMASVHERLTMTGLAPPIELSATDGPLSTEFVLPGSMPGRGEPSACVMGRCMGGQQAWGRVCACICERVSVRASVCVCVRVMWVRVRACMRMHTNASTIVHAHTTCLEPKGA